MTSSLPDSEEIVRDSLFRFLSTKVDGIKEDALDEIVLSYVTSIAEELTQDDVSGFDGDAFVEMLTAYLPQADNIEVGDAVRWMTGLANSLRNAKKHESSGEFDLRSVIEESASKTRNKRTPKVSESSDPELETKQNRKRVTKLSDTSDGGSEGLDEETFQKTVSLLLEMFPYSCSLEVTHCLQLMTGDVERTAQLIMYRHETGQSLQPSDRKFDKGSKVGVDDKAIKDRILGKYGFVDQEEDTRYHRPTLRAADDKKMIRYRDGKIVSTKGERFTQVSKQESEEMKKTIVNMLNPSLN